MAGITTNRPMGGRRGKDEVNRLRKPKERGSKPNRPTQLVGPWEERRNGKSGKSMGYIGKYLCIDNT